MRNKTIPLGLAVWLAAGMFVTMVVSVVVSTGQARSAVRTAIEREKAATAAATEMARHAFCLVITTQQNVYQESPPSTPAGRGAAEAWDSLSAVFQCEKG